MKYGEILYVSFDTIIPHLCLLDARQLGRLTKYCCEQVAQRQHLRSLAPELELMQDKVGRGLLVMYAGQMPPTWTILLPRIRELLPAFLAMEDWDVGTLMQVLLLEIHCGRPEPIQNLPLSMREHLQEVRSWLSRDMDGEKELRRVAKASIAAAQKICSAKEFADFPSDLTADGLAAMVCTQLLVQQDISRDSGEAAILRLGMALAQGTVYDDSEIAALLTQAKSSSQAGQLKLPTETKSGKPQVLVPVQLGA